MRIAIWHNLNSGGGKRALYYHVKGLVERGHYIVSYCPDTVDQQFLPLSSIVEEKIFPLKKHIDKKRYFESKDQILEKTTALLEHCKACAEDMTLNNFDVLLANSSSIFYMSHIGRFINIPKVIYLGEPYRKAYEAMPEFLWKAPLVNESRNKFRYLIRRVKHIYTMYWYSYLCREELISALSYDEILVNSIYSRETVKRSYGLEARVCYLGIDTQKFDVGKEKKENFVLGLGLIHLSKGIERSIDVISMIEEQKRPALIWVGNNTSNSQYIDKIRQYAVEKGVNLSIKTYIDDKELVLLLRKASVLLYLPNLEPFGLAPLEANACGTAVIAVKEGGLKETIQNNINGYTVDSYVPEEIAALVTLFSDLAFAKNLGDKARQYVKESWGYSKGIDNIEDCLYSVLNKSDNS